MAILSMKNEEKTKIYKILLEDFRGEQAI